MQIPTAFRGMCVLIFIHSPENVFKCGIVQQTLIAFSLPVIWGGGCIVMRPHVFTNVDFVQLTEVNTHIREEQLTRSQGKMENNYNQHSPKAIAVNSTRTI